MKEMVNRIARLLWPELDNRVHLPQLGRVVAIPDPPANGGSSTPERPRYAVDVRLLTPEMRIDDDMPLIRDVPVGLPGAGPERGFTALPKPGTIVEIAFAFGRLQLPFVRTVLPDGLALAVTDGASARWQQSAASFQEVDAAGNWKRATTGNIADIADGKIDQAALGNWTASGKKVWLGTATDNSLSAISDCLAAVLAAIGILAGHTHPNVGGCEQSGSISSAKSSGDTAKERLDLIKQ
ncbi:MAG: hypothetical protein AB7F40_05660 [Victivallaceae bacterium]